MYYDICSSCRIFQTFFSKRHAVILPIPDEFISQIISFCISCFPMVNLKIPLDFRILLAKSLPNFVKSCLSM